ncbi:MAG: leucine--tRNA ligase [Betaproteobacteria bacterium]|nr:leucine--tRNA ligase [Betaproteobacteria bacterium]
MESQYLPKQIESRAQAEWSRTDAYRVVEHAKDKNGQPKPKFYACSMLPYPSGKLHMGHVRNYTINDMMARQLRMKGYNVLQPMGWDAFGLPAENAALKNNVAPAKWTYENIAYMKKQCQAMGWAIDWSREFATCDPEYYKWNQWLFLRMLEKGIVYKKTQVVNWDPVDMTVLANEQVVDGRGWRSGAPVEKREIPGYYMAITNYAEELLDCVANKLTGWPASVRAMQENWIGKSVGVRFAFPHDIKDASGHLVQDGKLFVFTTRADTVMGVTFCAVAAEHPLATVAATRDAKVAAFIEETKRGTVMEADMATMEKKGVATGLFVTHPLTGGKVEVWVGNYVLMTYGDGAVMGVPGHDERDFEFAKKYGLPIKQVIDLGKPYSLDAWQPHYGDHGVCVESGAMDGMNYDAAIDYVAAQTKANGGEMKTQYRLRDWGISRQRYWGTPIPIIHCNACGDVPVPDKDLPVVLPQDLIPDGSGNPLNKDERFLKCVCPKCGKPAQRETDTMDTFVDSSWYYMRYTSPNSAPDYHDKMVSSCNDYWMPMDQYIGGITHAVLHLLYARFWTKVMRDLGMLKFDEPFTNLLCQGMVLNHIYSRRTDKGGIEYFPPDDVEAVLDAAGKPASWRLKSDGSAVEYGGVGTMSKSKLNGVDPQDMIDNYGADAARLFVMFASPPEQTIEWSSAGVEGTLRYLRRLWDSAKRRETVISVGLMQQAFSRQISWQQESVELRKFRFEVHTVLKQISYDFQRLQYNTVVSGCMKLLNLIDGVYLGGQPLSDTQTPISSDGRTVAVTEAFGVLLRVLYPACPHITWQLWNDLGFASEQGDIIDAPWPEPDPAALEQDEIEMVVQVNGKLRGSIRVPKAADKAAIEKLALEDEGVKRHTEGKPVKKLIVVPGKLVNVVV